MSNPLTHNRLIELGIQHPTLRDSSIQRSIIQWYQNLITAINRIEDLRIEEYIQAPTHLLPLRMEVMAEVLPMEVLTDNQEEYLYITDKAVPRKPQEAIPTILIGCINMMRQPILGGVPKMGD